MAKCKCEESRTTDPHWRIISRRVRGINYEYEIICLSCEWKWWSSAKYAHNLPYLNQEEIRKLQFPYEFTQK